MGNLWVKKPLKQILEQAADGEKSLKRTLGAVNLVALGIGAIIGAGLFVRTASAATEAAGSAVQFHSSLQPLVVPLRVFVTPSLRHQFPFRAVRMLMLM